ncbi:response regulator [Pelomonas sp. HMWF004]|nr:response regulator [Pelomonas sp. HMWF004]
MPAPAREALAGGGWQLVISDLMLPDGSAETLLVEGLARDAEAPPWVVFSAGLSDERHAAMVALGVSRTLRKPVSLVALLDTIAELLRGRPAASPRVMAEETVDPVQRHFGGDRALYESFRDGCISRFADDLRQGDAAQARADAASLRHVAHGLKAVLELIGQPALSGQARALEDAAAAWAPGNPWPAGWPALAEGLLSLGARRIA